MYKPSARGERGGGEKAVEAKSLSATRGLGVQLGGLPKPAARAVNRHFLVVFRNFLI